MLKASPTVEPEKEENVFVIAQSKELTNDADPSDGVQRAWRGRIDEVLHGLLQG